MGSVLLCRERSLHILMQNIFGCSNKGQLMMLMMSKQVLPQVLPFALCKPLIVERFELVKCSHWGFKLVTLTNTTDDRV